MLDTHDLPEISFAVVSDPERVHLFFVATATADFARLVAAYAAEHSLMVLRFAFTDPQIVSATRRWVADTAAETGRPPMVLVGSTENGQWVNWNLPAVPCPPVPSL